VLVWGEELEGGEGEGAEREGEGKACRAAEVVALQQLQSGKKEKI
jgi:hypothetical protein